MNSSSAGYQLFSVVGALDSAVAVARSRPGLVFGSAFVGVMPLVALLLGLEYLSATRAFVTSYDNDWVVLVAALFVPLCVAWRGVCGGVLMRIAVRRLTGPLPQNLSWSGLVPGSAQALREATAALVRVVATWLAPALSILAVLKIDPTLDTALRYSLVATVVTLSIPVVLTASSFTFLLPARASLGVPGVRGPGVAAIKSFSVSVLLGLLTALLIGNLHLGVHMVLYLADALFAADVSYWQYFLSFDNGLYAVVLLAAAAVLMEPVHWGVTALVWVDARVRVEALDLLGALDAVRQAPATRQPPTEGGPSRGQGDRATLNATAATGVSTVVAALLLLTVSAPSPVFAQEDEPAEQVQIVDVGVDEVDLAGESHGLTAEKLREARQALSEGTSDSDWIDVGPLRRYLDAAVETSDSPGEMAFWTEIRDDANDADLAWGDERQRAVASIRVRLDGPRLRSQWDGPTMAESEIGKADVDAAIGRIVAAKEYTDLSADAVDRNRSDGLFSPADYQRRDLDFLDEWCFQQDGADGKPAGSGVRGVPTEVYKIVAIVLLVIALGGLVLAIVRRVGQSRGTRPSRILVAGQPSALLDVHHDDPLQHSAPTWADQAAEFAQRGDFRLAIRALHWAVLVLLHRAEFIEYREAATNLEYEDELGRTTRQRHVGFEAVTGFARLTLAFDSAWYGEYPVGRDDYEQCAAAYQQVQTAVAAPGSEEGP